MKKYKTFLCFLAVFWLAGSQVTLARAKVRKKITVQAAVGEWQNSGGVVTAVGDKLDIVATGVWSFNCQRNTLMRNIHVHSSPDGKCVKCEGGKCGWPADESMPLPKAPAGALIGKINDRIFLVGTHFQVTVTPDLAGQLQFMMNDSNFFDNQCFYHDSLDIPKEFSQLDVIITHTAIIR